MTSDELYTMLDLRYPLPEWALWRQVCEAGTGGHRYADAVAMNLFPSRGMEVHGFELKVSRSDWLRELKRPDKADPLAKFCDHWWIVVSERDIVKDGELPPTWGLIAVRGSTLAQVVAAPKLEAEPLSRGFIATVLRRSLADGRFSWDSQIAKAVREERERLQADHEKELAEELEPYKAMEAALGISLRQFEWHGQSAAQVGLAMRQALEGERTEEAAIRRARSARSALQDALNKLDEVLATAEDAGVAA